MKSKVNVNGILRLEDLKHVKVAGQEVPIRNGYICDVTGFIKLTLRREYTSLIHEKSYTFMLLVKSTFNNVCQLQTCNSTSHKLIPNIGKYESPNKDTETKTKDSCKIIGAVFLHKVTCLFCRENVCA